MYNKPRMGRPPKYSSSDLEAVLYLNTTFGWGCLRISRKLGIPDSTVTRLLNSGRMMGEQGLRECRAVGNTDHVLGNELDALLLKDRISQLIRARDLLNGEITRLQRFQMKDNGIFPQNVFSVVRESVGANCKNSAG
jgi:hypothetical protein